MDAARVDTKPTNPKDAVGCTKPALHYVPMGPVYEAGLALTEGACKYGAHNWRDAGVRGSIYFDAALGHLTAWWEGEDVDEDSGVHHVTKAIAGLMVLRDAMLCGKYNDDRPPKTKNWRKELADQAAALHAKYPDPKPPITEA